MSADHLTSPSLSPADSHASPSRKPFGPFPLAVAPTLLPLQIKTLGAKRDRAANLIPCNPAKLQEAKRAKQAAWATADLRQDWADAGWLRAHLTVARLRVGVSNEPASVGRMKAKLRSIGIQSTEIQEAVGMTLAEFLKANPRFPLWVALAMVLEATGRFTPIAAIGDAA